jgi:hypothetical protein
MKGNMLRSLKTKVEEAKEEASKFLDPRTNKFDIDTLKTNFPAGVDPTKKEAYLDEQAF